MSLVYIFHTTNLIEKKGWDKGRVSGASEQSGPQKMEWEAGSHETCGPLVGGSTMFEGCLSAACPGGGQCCMLCHFAQHQCFSYA